MNRKAVNFQNWRDNADFREWLSLEYDIDTAPQSVRQQILHLLPLAVSEDRLLGNIRHLVLSEAIDQWNRPVEKHWFIQHGESRKWSYLGFGNIPPVIYLLSDQEIVWRIGRLKRDLTPGRYCRAPDRELMTDGLDKLGN